MKIADKLDEFTSRQGIISAEWCGLLNEVEKLEQELQKAREQLEVAEAVLSVQCTDSALAYFKDKQGEG